MTWADTQHHPNYDATTLRILLDKQQLEQLPFKLVSKSELSELMCHHDYNPKFYYPEDIKTLPAEAGHDLQFRYLVSGNGDQV